MSARRQSTPQDVRHIHETLDQIEIEHDELQHRIARVHARSARVPPVWRQKLHRRLRRLIRKLGMAGS